MKHTVYTAHYIAGFGGAAGTQKSKLDDKRRQTVHGWFRVTQIKYSTLLYCLQSLCTIEPREARIEAEET